MVLLNLVAKDTREGRVLSVLLDKLEKMREDLDDDKVFDVIGQQFNEVSLSELITKAIMDNQADASIHTIDKQLTLENIQNQIEGQQKLVTNSEVKRLLDNVQQQRESAETLRMLPAYVRGFFEDAAPLLGYQIEGDIETTFNLKPRPDFVQDVIKKYSGEQGQLTFSRELALPTGSEKPAAIFVHPGEPIFDAIRTRFLEKSKAEGDLGAVYFDPQTDEPYLFYLVRVPIVQKTEETTQILEDILVGIKRFADGRSEKVPAHLLLTLIPKTAKQNVPSTLSSEWINLAVEVETVKTFVRDNFGTPKLSHIHDELQTEAGK